MSLAGINPDNGQARRNRPGIIDCDIHPKVGSFDDLKPFLESKFQDRFLTYGQRFRHGHTKGFPYPKGQPLACRRDAWPTNGGGPGSDLELMREQLLDAHDVEVGIMNPLGATGQGYLDAELSAAMCLAANHWQLETWTKAEPRLRASVCVPYEDGPLARAEVERWAGNSAFAHVLLLSRTSEPLGQRRYWPIYEAAVAAGLPVGIHVFGYSGWPVTPGGWPSYYVEEMTEHAASAQALVSSLIFSGIFERLPDLRIVLIEAGFAWIPALGWRLDRVWARMRDEVPHVSRPPSEYLKSHFWVTTQPMEEPERAADIVDTMQWIGFDRILFATDYPHWDFDDPDRALPVDIDAARRRQIMSDNARALYGFA